MSSIGTLANAMPSLSPAHTCAQVLAYFTSHPDHETLPVVDDSRPVGLIARTTFVERFARRFHHELFGDKSCGIFMDQQPMMVDTGASISTVGMSVAAENAKALQQGLIVTEQGRYVGVCTGSTLVRALADLERARSNQILDSVRYASRIQRAFLHTSHERLTACLPVHEIFWEPRDLVGGDYYFCRGDADRTLVAVFDCTGHGVPGALMTMIMSSSLEAAIADAASWQPTEVLSHINRRARASLGQHVNKKMQLHESSGSVTDDGMDAAAVLIDRRSRTLRFAGAKLPLFVSYPGHDAWVCLPAGRHGIGYADTPDDTQWPGCELPLVAGMRIAIATDGVFDQIGEQRAQAYGKQRFVASLGVGQGVGLRAHFENAVAGYRQWQGSQVRRDDATLLMFEVQQSDVEYVPG